MRTPIALMKEKKEKCLYWSRPNWRLSHNTIVSVEPFEDRPYITTDVLPEGDGPLMCTEDGTLYRGSIPQDPVIPPNPMDEIDLLKKQLKAASDQNDFLEDCIAEMAEIVYA